MLIPVSIGGLIYLIYRSPDTLINQIFNQLYPNSLALFLQYRLAFPFPDTLIYQLPGGLWTFSATLATFRLRLSVGRYWLPLYYFPLAYCILLECLQYLHVTDGTFDIVDLCYDFFFWLLARWFQERYLPIVGTEMPSRRTWQLAVVVCLFLALFLGDQ